MIDVYGSIIFQVEFERLQLCGWRSSGCRWCQLYNCMARFVISKHFCHFYFFGCQWHDSNLWSWDCLSSVLSQCYCEKPLNETMMWIEWVYLWSMINWKWEARVFIPNELCGERARQQRDRKRESVRDRVFLKMKDSISNKLDHWRKFLWQRHEVKLWEHICSRCGKSDCGRGLKSFEMVKMMLMRLFPWLEYFLWKCFDNILSNCKSKVPYNVTMCYQNHYLMPLVTYGEIFIRYATRFVYSNMQGIW